MGNRGFSGGEKGRFSGQRASGGGKRPPQEEAQTQSADSYDAFDFLDDDLKQVLSLELDDPLEHPADGVDLPEEMVRGEQEEVHNIHRRTQQEPEKKQKKAKKSKKPKPALRAVAWLLGVLLFIESAYCVIIFTDWIKPLSALRSIYIDTAMSTFTHQWLATALIPGDVVQAVVDKTKAHQDSQIGVDSHWGDADKVPEETKSPSSGFSKDAAASILSNIAQDVGFTNEEERFFEKFYELDEKSTRDYAEAHPEVIANGWDKFYVNEAGLDDSGTDIYTTQGDQVLAVDAANGLMVVRVTGSTYRGVLVIGKDASRLKVAPSSQWGQVGEWIGDIATKNNGLVAMTGSGFADAPGVPEGSDQTGLAIAGGEHFGYRGPWGYKRIELREDNRLYIVDAPAEVHPDTTDATEFTPALIVDGVNVSSQDNTYTALNPRAAIGQTKDESILMLGIEGRKIDSIGTNSVEVASIMERYGAYQALNLDGGTSAGVWYEGEYIMRCSNSNLIPHGRRLPNAWVYAAETVADP